MPEPTIRERLLELESKESKLQDRVARPLEELMHRKLSLTMKISFTVTMLMGIGFAVGFTWVGLTAPKGLPWIIKAAFFEGAVFGLGWAVLMGWILKRGRVHITKADDIIQGLTFAFIVLLMIHLMMAGDLMKDNTVAIKMVLNGLVFLILFGVPAMLHMRLRNTENMFTERLLQIELKLTEMMEKEANK